jgi:hypothetical protein
MAAAAAAAKLFVAQDQLFIKVHMFQSDVKFGCLFWPSFPIGVF